MLLLNLNIKSLFALLYLSLSVPNLVSSFAPKSPSNNALNMGPSLSSTALKSKPFVVCVEAEIKPDRMADFLDVIEKDAIGSRQEEGCLRFDVIQDQGNPNKFMFYEVYTDLDAVLFHKEQPHFALWTDFKASGGVVSSVSHKCDGLFMSE